MLEASQLAAFRGERLVFSDLSLSVPRGGAVLLLGPNGAGKSTLLRVLAGLLRPDAGTVRLDQQDVFDDTTAHARRIGYLGHQDAVKPGLTVAENLRFAARLGGGVVTDALRAVALDEYDTLPARVLSAGQRRRLALARLLLRPAALWLLDEPSVGLDTASVDRLAVMMAAHRASGGMIVAATHPALPLPDASVLRMDPA